MSDPIFQRGLQDLIKGIRSHKRDPSAFVSQAIAEIKSELTSTDPVIKAEAVRKLTYLQMTGYNVSWAAFAIVEVMSQSRFAHKRIGYLAANQSFDESTDVILLTTNLFKKEFSAMTNNQYEIGLAINCLANIATKDLARDCIGDLVTLMNHSKTYIRKKAVLAMYKLYVKYPQGLRLTFEKLKERLDDPESSVVSTAVNVICELANKNPKNYLAMAPKFFKLLTSSTNNWMLIKVVKLLGSLVSEEPRLARKLLDPMASIIQNTQAKSLQFECIYTITEALPFARREDGSEVKNTGEIIQLCSDYLRGFIEDNDQNLKYLGLVGLVNLMKSYPRVVVEHRDLVLKCLNDDDVTIRTKSLELLAGIVSRKSLVDLVHHLLEHARKSEGEYRDEIIAKIMAMCKRDKYSMVEDFAWYTSILLELSIMKGSKHGKEVADQLIDVSLRVDTVRPYAVESMISMLLNEKLFLSQARFTVSEVLKAAAWIVGEYSEIITAISRDNAPDDAEDGSAFWIDGASVDEFRSEWRNQNVHVMIIETLLHSRSVNLPSHVQSVYIQSAMKIFVRASCDCNLDSLAEVMKAVRSQIPVFLQSPFLEVQERASTFRYLLVAMDILPLNWEDMTEQVSTHHGDGEVISEQQAALDLLDMPIYTPGSIKAVDDRGAKSCSDHKDTLKTVIAEKFYAVHSKAQSRVPIPDSLDLENAFEQSALSDLLDVEIDNNLSLHALHFVPPVKGIHEDDRLSTTSKFYDEAAVTNPITSKSFTDPFDNSLNLRDKGRDDVFMLGSGGDIKHNNDIIPLSKILGDNFQEIPSSKKSKRKSSSKSKKGNTINMTDLLPAGMEGSDDDKTKKSSKKKKNSEIDEVGLDTVDITAPLREDEVFATYKHRVVPTATEEPISSSTIEPKETKKDKTKRSKKHAPTPDVRCNADELLGLDFGSIEESTEPPQLIKKNKDGYCLKLYSDDHVSLVYSVIVSSNRAAFQIKTTNSDGDPLNVSLLLPTTGFVKCNGSGTKLLASNLITGTISAQTVEVFFSGVLDKSLDIPCTLVFTTDSLLEPISRSVPCVLHLSVCNGCIPLVIDDSKFMIAVNKPSVGGIEKQFKVSKASKAMKSIIHFLNAHVVEEITDAISISCRSYVGHDVFGLIKSSGKIVTVDIKCDFPTKRESENFATEVQKSLCLLVL